MASLGLKIPRRGEIKVKITVEQEELQKQMLAARGANQALGGTFGGVKGAKVLPEQRQEGLA